MLSFSFKTLGIKRTLISFMFNSFDSMIFKTGNWFLSFFHRLRLRFSLAGKNHFKFTHSMIPFRIRRSFLTSFYKMIIFVVILTLINIRLSGFGLILFHILMNQRPKQE